MPNFLMLHLRVILFLIVGVGCGQNSSAQSRWEFGASGIFLNYFGDFTPKNVVSTETHGGWGGYLKYAFKPSWGLRVQFTGGDISGHFHNFAAGTDQRRLGFEFKNRTQTYISILDWEPLYHLRWGKKKFYPGLSPFFSVGHGLIFHQPKVNFKTENDFLSEELRKNIALDQTNRNPSPSLMLHFSAGTKLYFSKSTALGFEAAFQPVFSDYLDGVSLAANPKNKDGMFSIVISFSYILHQKIKDSDGDGVPDAQDDCPHERGKNRNRGCPDSDIEKLSDRDGDGVPDSIDKCPDERGNMIDKGCPKSKKLKKN